MHAPMGRLRIWGAVPAAMRGAAEWNMGEMPPQLRRAGLPVRRGGWVGGWGVLNMLTTTTRRRWRNRNGGGQDSGVADLWERGGAPCAVRKVPFSTPSSHGSQGPEFCTPDAVLNGSCTLL